jgi:PAS domain S-box-containing protein
LTPSTHENAANGLTGRHSYDTWDITADEAFDDMTAVTASLLDAPISLISLLDDSRQWVASRLGLEAADASHDLDFCNHAVVQQELFVVADAVQDHRFADSPLVTGDQQIRFYAGAPLIAPSGHVLGTLCIMDRAPRILTPIQMQTLLVLGKQIVRELDMRDFAMAAARDLAKSMRVEEALRTSEEHFRQLVEGVSDYAIFELDTEGRVANWNAGAARVKGYTEAEILGKHFSIFYSKQDITEGKPEHELEAALSEGRYEQEGWRVRKDGSEMWANVTITPMWDRDGHLTGYLKVTRDISERKQAEADREQRQFLASIITTQNEIAMAGPSLNTVMNLVAERTQILTHADAAVVELEEDGEMVYRAASGTLAAHVGLHVKVGGNLPGMCCRAETALRSDDTERDPRFDQGACRRLNIRSMIVVPMCQDQQVIGVLQVVASRPQAFKEQDIQTLQLMAGLISAAVANVAAFDAKQVLVRDRAATLAALRANEGLLHEQSRELVRSNTDLEQFAYVASHDLQEPLRMIGSYLELLDLEYRERLDDEAREYIAYAVDGAVRMKCLINDLLAYSRVGTQGKPMQLTSVGTLLVDVLADLQMLIVETGAVITYDPLPVVSADRSQLRLVLQNLIGNAIKFCGAEAPRIHISATAVDSEWRFSVADNGLGIKPKHAERIFVIFQRLHNKSQYTGTGIGLTTCKRVVERHGGRIWVESELGSGSTFIFSLPQAVASSPEMPAT